jgi:Fe2+ or Zn2+ uptake regulation protein
MDRSLPPGGLDDALLAIRSAGGRVTPTKRLLLEIMIREPGHRTTDDLITAVQADGPDVAASTIYRILEELERIGLVEHSHAGKGPATYHLRTTAHGHLVCQRCGSMAEADPELFSQLVHEALDRYGFAVDPHHFAVLGECRACRSLEA